MTVPRNAVPRNTNQMEPKVKWPALAIYLTGVACLALVNAFTGNENELLIAALPDTIEPFVLPIVPVLVQTITGWFAPHQWRNPEVTGNL